MSPSNPVVCGTCGGLGMGAAGPRDINPPRTACPDCSGAKVNPDHSRESNVEAIGQEIAKWSADLNARLAVESPKEDN